jgi:hypothetical protein
VPNAAATTTMPYMDDFPYQNELMQGVSNLSWGVFCGCCVLGCLLCTSTLLSILMGLECWLAKNTNSHTFVHTM